LHQCCVVVNRRRNRYASFHRLALAQISATDIKHYLCKVVLVQRILDNWSENAGLVFIGDLQKT
ncbi:MAG: hypothetical protein WCD89_20135, partial [Anaerocolumna sp.]